MSTKELERFTIKLFLTICSIHVRTMYIFILFIGFCTTFSILKRSFLFQKIIENYHKIVGNCQNERDKGFTHHKAIQESTTQNTATCMGKANLFFLN
jgi:hypothetical protein